MSRIQLKIQVPTWALIVSVTGLAFIARIYHLSSPLWFDEIMTLIQSVQGTLLETVSSFKSNNNHPLYTFLAKISFLIFGESEWSFRLPAAIFGTLSVPALFVFCSRILTKTEALAAASILAFSYNMVWFSQNARGYTALLFFTIMCSFFLQLAVVEKKKPVLNYVLYAVSLALASYTHLTMVLVGIAHYLCILVYLSFRANRDNLSVTITIATFAYIFAAILVIVFYAPMLGDVIAFFLNGARESSGPKSAEIANAAWVLTTIIDEVRITFGGWTQMALASALLGIGGLSLLRSHPFMTIVALSPIPLIIFATVALGRPIFPRFFFGFSAFFLLAGVHGLWVFLKFSFRGFGFNTYARLIFLGLIIASLIFNLNNLRRNYTIPKQNYEAAAKSLTALNTGNSAYVVGLTTDRPFRQYLHMDFERIDNLSEFFSIQAEQRPFYVAYTFPNYVALGSPQLWKELQKSCTKIDNYPATVKGGDISILKCY